MKKNLLLLLAGAIAGSPAFATDDPVVFDNLIFSKMSADANWLLADDGQGSIVILDRANDKKYEYGPDSLMTDYYSLALGTAVSNNGVVLATTTPGMMDASYWQNGEWNLLPIDEAYTGMCSSHSVTPDGKRICGNVGQVEFSINADQVMVVPAVWTLGEDGKYGKCELLPHPDTDFTGRTPQYITAVCMSDDGKTILGQIQDYTGFLPQPIVYTQGEDGKWSYKTLMADIFNPEGETWPVWPGDDAPTIQEYMTQAQIAAYDEAVNKYNEAYAAYQERKPKPEDYMTDEEKTKYQDAIDNWDPMTSFYPVATDFMTEEEIEKYNAALAVWSAEGEAPSITDYMTADELAAYNKALEDYTSGEMPKPEDFISAAGLAKYNEALAAWKKNPLCYPNIEDFVSPDKLAEYKAAKEKWDKEFEAFMDKYDEVSANLPAFIFNDLSLSPNAKYAASTSMHSDFWSPEEITLTYVFDLAAGEFYEKDVEGLVSWVGDNGQIITCAPIRSEDRSSFITTGLEEEAIPFHEYVKSKNEALYKWMEQNMRHDYYYWVYNPDTDTEEMQVEENKWFTGSVIPSADLKTFVSWIANTWSEDADAPFYYSYVLSLDYVAGIASAEAESDIELSADANGRITIKGSAASVSVYDMSGREVYRSDGIANSFSTGLASGMYIIKAVDAKGASKILKSSF